MTQVVYSLTKPLRLSVILVSSSVIAFFLGLYRWFTGSLGIRDLGFIAAMLAVLLFMAFMMMNLRSIKRPNQYTLEVYDAFGEEDDSSFRKEFRNYDVAVSYMQMYRKMYPHYRFVLVSRTDNVKKTVHKWLD